MIEWSTACIFGLFMSMLVLWQFGSYFVPNQGDLQGIVEAFGTVFQIVLQGFSLLTGFVGMLNMLSKIASKRKKNVIL